MREVSDWGAFLLIPAARYGGSGASVDARRQHPCGLAAHRARFRSDIAPSSPLNQPRSSTSDSTRPRLRVVRNELEAGVVGNTQRLVRLVATNVLEQVLVALGRLDRVVEDDNRARAEVGLNKLECGEGHGRPD